MMMGSRKACLTSVIPAVLLLGSLLTAWRLFGDGIDSRLWLGIASKVGSANASSTIPGKTIVVPALSTSNTSWVANELPDWNHAIYVVDADAAGIKTQFKVPKNKGNEANVYLWYILQHYDNLPEVILFMHAHRDGEVRAWHVDNEEHSNPLAAQRLRLDTVMREGFVNLRCIQIPGCPDGVRPNYTQTEIPSKPDTVDIIPDALYAMFPTGFPYNNPDGHATTVYPDQLAAPCCAQFAVSREAVLRRPRSDYERYHNWLMTTTMKDYTSGRVFEYLWHIIFGKEAVFCPAQHECACKNYGHACKN